MPLTRFGWESSDSLEHQRMLLPAILRHLPNRPARILDLGCGNGWLSEQYRVAGFDVTACDSSEDGIEIGRAAFPLVRFELHDAYAALGGPFDCIVASEVIEHLFAPKRMLDRAFEALVPGGRLVLSTPYHGWLKNVAIAAAGKFDSHVDVSWEGGHIKFFSRGTLEALVAAAGFVDLRFCGVGRAPLLWKSMIVVGTKPI